MIVYFSVFALTLRTPSTFIQIALLRIPPVKHDIALPTSMTSWPSSMPKTKLSALSSLSAIYPGTTHKIFSKWTGLFLRSRAGFPHEALQRKRAWAFLSKRSLAQVRPEPLSELWFTACFATKTRPSYRNHVSKDATSPASANPHHDQKPPDQRTLKLGKTLRTLSPLLPTIFTSPLPHEILNAGVSLHLFPSTHPHLPVVKSRVPCRAALWTAPVAWGSVPIVGNVKVEVMSEKMVRTGLVSAPPVADVDCDGLVEEKLVVRWKTEGKGNGSGHQVASQQPLASSSNEINRGLSTLLGGSQPLFSKGSSDPFTGLFIFSFDQDGRIASMTIEHADESNGFDKTSKVVTLTDWLLGKARWGRVEGALVPGLAYKEMYCRHHENPSPSWRRRE